MNQKGVVHFEVAGTNGDKSRKFYSDLFGWNFELMGEFDYGVTKAASENSIGGGIGSAPEGFKPYVTFYVLVDDLQAYLNKAESLGGKTIQPPTPIPGVGASAMFADIDGNMIGLFKADMSQGG